jgi:serine/threonine protein kinase
MANHAMKLAVGGPVQAKYGTYLSRPADEQLLQACQAGKFAYVLACRQIGKSSLMFATSEKLTQAAVQSALIDLNSIGQTVEPDSWYFSFIDELARKLKLKVDVPQWWESRPRLLTPTQRFLQFLREVLLEEIPGPIVIFVDEIDMTLGLGYTDDFFAAIRSVHNDRAQHPAYRRLTFVLLGVATPDELIKDHTRTPFNVGQAITLEDFTKDECQPFRLEIEARYPEQGAHFFDCVYDWTNGHPYLTQKLCDALLKANAPAVETDGLVDILVRKFFLAAEARSEDNIQFVQTRVTSDPYAHEMLKTYRRILERQEPVYDDEQSPPLNRLKLYGLVVARNGKLEVRNKLYTQAFGLAWINEMLSNIRLGLPSRYKILQEIGQGGFSTVFLAQLQQAGQAQTVALKVLKSAGGNDTTQFKRFKQEARAVARLEHPNIIRIFETSADEEPSFIAMEYIPGGALRDRLRGGPLLRPEAMDIVRQIGGALTYAHSQGIIHRDVNPNNILLDTRSNPSKPRPVLTDFGLVKLLLPDDHSPVASTATVMGTFGYMAPEQWKQATPTPATDVYALAITFFEMLSGKRPFEAISPFELMDKHTKEPLPLLSGLVSDIGPFFDEPLRRAAAKEPADRFSSMDEFISVLETANEQAEEFEQITRQKQALQMVEAAQSYIRKGRYNAERALAMIEAALETYPNYLDALRLRGKIRWQHGQHEQALADYQQAFAQKPDPDSTLGLEYLELLDRAAELLWERQLFDDAAGYYETIRYILAEVANQVTPSQIIKQRAQSRLISYYHDQGDTAYANGTLGSMDEAIRTLEENIAKLGQLMATDQAVDLQHKLKQLQITKYQHVIKAAQGAIGEIGLKDSQVRFGSEEIFQHYVLLEEAYQALLQLEPENRTIPEDRHKKLREWAEARCVFASRALGKLEPDHEAALRHYRAILELEQTKYPGLSQELHLNLSQKIAELQVKVDHDGKYHEIRKLIESGEHAKALEYLDREFIQTGNYEHRDVARLLWGLVYAKYHEGILPPEWESLTGFEVLSKRLVNIEQGRIHQLKDRLEPWSQVKILETINRENRRLGEYEEQVRRIEALLNEAVAHGLPDIDTCRNELRQVRTQIQAQRDIFFQVDVNQTAQKVEGWLQRLEDIENLLQTSEPLKNIPRFLDELDTEQPIIDKDPLLEKLQQLVFSNVEIDQIINQLKLEIRGQLVRVLIDEVGQKDEAAALSRQEATRAEALVKRIAAEMAEKRAELAKAQEKINELQHSKGSTEKQLKKLEQQRELHKYLIPISLAVAVLAGGVIAEQLNKLLPGIAEFMSIALFLLIAYFCYYIWIYYLSRPGDKS